MGCCVSAPTVGTGISPSKGGTDIDIQLDARSGAAARGVPTPASAVAATTTDDAGHAVAHRHLTSAEESALLSHPLSASMERLELFFGLAAAKPFHERITLVRSHVEPAIFGRILPTQKVAADGTVPFVARAPIDALLSDLLLCRWSDWLYPLLPAREIDHSRSADGRTEAQMRSDALVIAGLLQHGTQHVAAMKAEIQKLHENDQDVHTLTDLVTRCILGVHYNRFISPIPDTVTAPPAATAAGATPAAPAAAAAPPQMDRKKSSHDHKSTAEHWDKFDELTSIKKTLTRRSSGADTDDSDAANTGMIGFQPIHLPPNSSVSSGRTIAFSELHFRQSALTNTLLPEPVLVSVLAGLVMRITQDLDVGDSASEDGNNSPRRTPTVIATTATDAAAAGNAAGATAGWWYHDRTHPAWNRLVYLLAAIKQHLFFRSPNVLQKIGFAWSNSYTVRDMVLVNAVLALLGTLRPVTGAVVPIDASDDERAAYTRIREHANEAGQFFALTRLFFDACMKCVIHDCSIEQFRHTIQPFVAHISTHPPFSALSAAASAQAAALAAAPPPPAGGVGVAPRGTVPPLGGDPIAVFIADTVATIGERRREFQRDAKSDRESSIRMSAAPGGGGPIVVVPPTIVDAEALRPSALIGDDDFTYESASKIIEQTVGNLAYDLGGDTRRVYKVFIDHKEYACKVLRTAETDAPAAVSALVHRVQRDAHLMRTLKLQRCVGFVGSYTKPPTLIIVTQFMAGGSLADRMRARPFGAAAVNAGPLTDQIRYRFSLQIGESLMELHRQQPPCIHKTLTPNNVLLDESDNIRLSDFGTHTSRVVSSAAAADGDQYQPPETWDVSLPLTPYADVYSYGVVLHELWTGQLPDGILVVSTRAERLAAFRRAQTGKEPTIGVVDPKLRRLHPDVALCIEKCIQIDASLRPSAEAVVSVFRSHIDAELAKAAAIAAHAAEEKKAASLVTSAFRSALPFAAPAAGAGGFRDRSGSKLHRKFDLSFGGAESDTAAASVPPPSIAAVLETRHQMPPPIDNIVRSDSLKREHDELAGVNPREDSKSAHHQHSHHHKHHHKAEAASAAAPAPAAAAASEHHKSHAPAAIDTGDVHIAMSAHVAIRSPARKRDSIGLSLSPLAKSAPASAAAAAAVVAAPFSPSISGSAAARPHNPSAGSSAERSIYGELLSQH